MRAYLLVIFFSASITYLVTPFVKKMAILLNAQNEPRARDVHLVPTPRLGGIALYLGILSGYLISKQIPALEIIYTYPDIKAALIAGGVITFIGAVDDIFSLDALSKLAGQVFAIGLMTVFGLQILFLTLPRFGAISLGTEGIILAIFLSLVVMNAVNFIDGLDGLAAGVTLIAASSLFLFSYLLSTGFITDGLNLSRISAPTLLLALLIGATIGFLPYNFFPAKMFLGDSGALLIGVMLSASFISLTGQNNYNTLSPSTTFPLYVIVFLPLGVLFLPLLDLFLAVLRRTKNKKSIFVSDKEHLHHQLLEIGHSHKKAVLVLYAWSFLLSYGAVSLALEKKLAPAVGLLIVIMLFYTFQKRIKWLRRSGSKALWK